MVVLWQLVDSSITGVLVAAVVLDNATNFGQVSTDNLAMLFACKVACRLQQYIVVYLQAVA